MYYLRTFLVISALLYSCALAAPPTFGSCTIFPADDEWNRPIDTDEVDPLSTCLVNVIGSFQPSTWGSSPLRLDYSMAFNRVATSPTLRPLTYGNGDPLESYQSESDWYTSNGVFQNGNTPQGSWSNPPYLPALSPAEGVKIEGGLDATTGDRHMVTVDTDKCMLYETYITSYNSATGGYTVAGSAVWNLSAPAANQRPDRWTSADAAGLPIYPGVLKLEEIQAGAVNHALRFTASRASRAYTFPASHFGQYSNASLPHYGARFRLKATFDISRYSAQTQVLLVALKKYGLIFADQGSSAYITCDEVAFGDPINREINQGFNRIEFNTTNFEMVKSRGPIVRLFTPTAPIPCDSTPTVAPTPQSKPSPTAVNAPKAAATPTASTSAPAAKSTTPTNNSSGISVIGSFYVLVIALFALVAL